MAQLQMLYSDWLNQLLVSWIRELHLPPFFRLASWFWRQPCSLFNIAAIILRPDKYNIKTIQIQYYFYPYHAGLTSTAYLTIRSKQAASQPKLHDKGINFFLNTHLSFPLNFTVVCHCQVVGAYLCLAEVQWVKTGVPGVKPL